MSDLAEQAETVYLIRRQRSGSSPGGCAAHRSAVLDDQSDVFDSATASQMTGMRNRLEYLDASSSTEVDEAAAREAGQLAERAIEVATSFVDRASGST